MAKKYLMTIPVNSRFFGPTAMNHALISTRREVNDNLYTYFSAENKAGHRDTTGRASDQEAGYDENDVRLPKSVLWLWTKGTKKNGDSHQDETHTHDWSTTISESTSKKPRSRRVVSLLLTYRPEHRRKSNRPYNRQKRSFGPTIGR